MLEIKRYIGITKVAKGIIKPLNNKKKKKFLKRNLNFANTYPRSELENIDIKVIPPDMMMLLIK